MLKLTYLRAAGLSVLCGLTAPRCLAILSMGIWDRGCWTQFSCLNLEQQGLLGCMMFFKLNPRNFSVCLNTLVPGDMLYFFMWKGSQ